MSEARVHEPAAESQPALEPAPVPAMPPAAGRVLALQRSAGNAAVSRWLQVARDPPAAPAAPAAPAGPAAAPAQPRVSYVFLMGDFSNDAFYEAAHKYYANTVKSAIMVTDKRTLADVIAHVNAAGKPVDTLFIVSHANESGNLAFSVDAADAAKDASQGDQKPRSEYDEVKAANESKSLPAADVKLIDAQTKVQIKGCNIGRSELMLEELDKAFGGEATVTAPTHTQEYKYYGDASGQMHYEENFAEMFLEEPGLVDKNPAAVAAAFKAKYPQVPAKSWTGLLKSVKREPKSRTTLTHTASNPPADEEKAVIARAGVKAQFPEADGWTLAYKGRTTVGTEYKYAIQAERIREDGATVRQTVTLTVKIPPTDDALIAQEKAKHGRPDAWKWRVKRQVKGDDLVLDVIAERTEWTIAGTIKDAAGPYQPPQSDAGWYKSSTYDPTPPPATP